MSKSEPVDLKYVYRQLWLRALTDPVEITYKDKKQAQAVRMHLYRFLQPYREDEFLDIQLYEASVKLAAAVDGTKLRIFPKREYELIAMAAEQLNLPVQDAEKAKELEDIAARMMRVQAEVSAARDAVEIPDE